MNPTGSYRYFISYSIRSAQGVVSFGNSEVVRSDPITGIDGVRQVEQGLTSMGVPNPIVLAFTRLDGAGVPA